MGMGPKTEETFRELLDRALHNRLDDVASLIATVGPQAYETAAALAIQVTGHVVIDTAERWPTEADLREIARLSATAITGLLVTEDMIGDCLSRVVFGSESVMDVFAGNQDAPVIPLFTLANVILSFTPKGLHWSDYLDRIETGIEAAGSVPDDVLPSMVYRFVRKPGHHPGALRGGR